MKETFQFAMKSSIKSLKDLSDFIIRTLQNRIKDQSTLDDLLITADEIATNIIIHAYKNQNEQYIKILLEIHPDKIILTFRHKGEVFEPEKVNKPNFQLPLYERPTEGMGLYIINHLMDKIIYKFKKNPDEENIITVEKKIVTQKQGESHAS